MFKKIIDVGSMLTVEVNSDKVGVLKRTLTITSTDRTSCTIELYNTIDANKNIYDIPRSFIKSNICIEDREEWFIDKFSISFYLREEQKKLKDSYIDSIKDNYGGIIKAKTGTGKTNIAIAIASDLGLRTLIIVPTDRLMSQWKERFLEFTDIKEEEIGIIRQNKCEVEDKKIVIGMVHSLAQKDYSSEIYSSFGLVIYDEIHVLGAETFSRTAPLFNCKYRLGLSATPKRKDGMANIFFYHIGKIVAESSQSNATIKVVLVPYNGKDTSQYSCVWSGELILGRYYNKLANSLERTKLLSNIINILFSKGKDILVLSDRIKILENIKEILIELGVPEEDIGFFTGSKKKELDKKIILGTYGSAGLGADIKRLSALVFATPRVDIEQAVGRVLRQIDTEATVVDVIDTSSSIMIGWSYARQKFYKREGANIIRYEG